MSADYFILGGRDSRDFQVYLSNTGIVRERQFSIGSEITSARIIGRDGEYVFDQFYKPESFTLDCFTTNNLNDNTFIRKLSGWITKLGNRQLILSYEPYKYREVYTDKNSKLQDFGSQGGMFSFDVRAYSPFGFSRFTTLDIINGIYYDSGAIYDSGLLYAEDYSDSYQATNITSGDTMTIINGGTFTARPNIIFEGQATTLLVEQYSDSALTNKINEFSYGAFNGTLEVNSLLSNTYLDDSITESIDTTFPYAGYISLNPTDESNEINSGGLGLVNTVSTVTLGSYNASAVDDYYNGKYIIIKYGLNTYMRQITDYVGATKLATLDSDLPVIPTYAYDYSIVDLSTGENYFKITGTGFSSLDVTFDFRFVYL